jgi:hypothetical protein
LVTELANTRSWGWTEILDLCMGRLGSIDVWDPESLPVPLQGFLIVVNLEEALGAVVLCAAFASLRQLVRRVGRR